MKRSAPETKSIKGYYYDSTGDHEGYDPAVHTNFTFATREKLLESICDDINEQEAENVRERRDQDTDGDIIHVDITKEFKKNVYEEFKKLKEDDYKWTIEVILEQLDVCEIDWYLDLINIGHTVLDGSAESDSDSDSESDSESDWDSEDDEPPAKKVKQ
jgi:hypothetical protein